MGHRSGNDDADVTGQAPITNCPPGAASPRFRIGHYRRRVTAAELSRPAERERRRRCAARHRIGRVARRRPR